MVALCGQCGAALGLADLGYDRCLNCHWQHVFDFAADPAHAGEVRLALYRPVGAGGGAARDKGGRPWEPVVGDGATWCALCGATIRQGWRQALPGAYRPISARRMRICSPVARPGSEASPPTMNST